MKTLLCALLVLTFIYSSFQLYCYSTGDPHYMTFKRRRYDLYGWYGDFVLASCKRANMKILTRVRQGQYWRNRGLNTAIAVAIDGNVIQTFGSHYYINGVKNAPLNSLKHNVKLLRRGNRWEVRGPSGGRAVWHQYSIYKRRKVPRRWRGCTYFNNVYVYFPKKCNRRSGSGLCGRAISRRDDNRITSHGYLRSIRLHPKSNMNIFFESYVPRKVHTKITHRRWPSNAIRRKCHKFCFYKVKKRNNLYSMCMDDCRISKGRTNKLLGFGKATADKRELLHMGHHKRKGVYWSVYSLLLALKKQLLKEKRLIPRRQANARAQLRAAQNKVNKQRGVVAAETKKLKQLQNQARTLKGKLSGVLSGSKKSLREINAELQRILALMRHVRTKYLRQK